MSYSIGDLKEATRYLEEQAGLGEFNIFPLRKGIVEIAREIQEFVRSDEFKRLTYFAKLQSLDIAVWFPPTIDGSRNMFPIRFNAEGLYCERPQVSWEEHLKHSYRSDYDPEPLALCIRESEADFVDIITRLREEIAEQIEEIRTRQARSQVYSG